MANLFVPNEKFLLYIAKLSHFFPQWHGIWQVHKPITALLQYIQMRSRFSKNLQEDLLGLSCQLFRSFRWYLCEVAKIVTTTVVVTCTSDDCDSYTVVCASSLECLLYLWIHLDDQMTTCTHKAHRSIPIQYYAPRNWVRYTWLACSARLSEHHHHCLRRFLCNLCQALL